MKGDTATLTSDDTFSLSWKCFQMVLISTSDMQENMHVEVHKAINEKPSVRFMCLPK